MYKFKLRHQDGEIITTAENLSDAISRVKYEHPDYKIQSTEVYLGLGEWMDLFK